MKNLIISLIVCVLLAPAALAGDYDGRALMFTISGGGFMPTSDFDDIDGELGSAYGAEAQYFFNDNIGIGLYFTQAVYSTDNITIAGDEYAHEIDSSHMGVSLILRLPMENVDIYGLAGVGVADSTYELIQEQNDIEYVERQTDYSMAYRFEAGARYYVWNALSIGLNAGYLMSEMDVKHDRGAVFENATEKLGGFFFGMTAAVAL
ncbi:MAG: porin family protein [Deferribacteraceae bacterium]|jgi:opacity protein-like surface antigen|nr:porin family protein [Deferribacteraceae bacterium]